MRIPFLAPRQASHVSSVQPGSFVESLESRTMLSASSARRDASYLQQESIVNLSEINLSNLALTHSTNTEVLALANRLITDYTASEQDLQTIATAHSISLDTSDRKHNKLLAKLTTLTGKKFDLAFSKLEVQDHKQSIKRNTAEAKKTTDADIQTYASAQVPTLQEQLALAQTALSSSKAESNT
jgi:predicted outer membrane protein